MNEQRVIQVVGDVFDSLLTVCLFPIQTLFLATNMYSSTHIETQKASNPSPCQTFCEQITGQLHLRQGLTTVPQY